MSGSPWCCSVLWMVIACPLILLDWVIPNASKGDKPKAVVFHRSWWAISCPVLLRMWDRRQAIVCCNSAYSVHARCATNRTHWDEKELCVFHLHTQARAQPEQTNQRPWPDHRENSSTLSWDTINKPSGNQEPTECKWDNSCFYITRYSVMPINLPKSDECWSMKCRAQRTNLCVRCPQS